MKILTIIGTRPEAIKMAILQQLLCDHEKFDAYLCHSGQHQDLAQDIFKVFDLKPDFELNAISHSDSMAVMMSYLMGQLQVLVEKVKPEMILIQGDTMTSYCGAMIAFLNKIKLGHVEAGLRTYDKLAPFPEEIFRQFNDKVADLYFAPSESAKSNLIKEDCNESQIYITGNTGIDALLYIQKEIQRPSFTPSEELLRTLNNNRSFNKLILLTLHRRENHGEMFNKIKDRLEKLMMDSKWRLVHVRHPNPNIFANNKYESSSNITVIPALNYKDFVWLMNQADLILTDSGGVQEEAPYIGKPLIVLRPNTERQEVINEKDRIMFDLESLENDIKNMINTEVEISENIYGDGTASRKILSILENY